MNNKPITYYLLLITYYLPVALYLRLRITKGATLLQKIRGLLPWLLLQCYIGLLFDFCWRSLPLRLQHVGCT